MCQVELINTIDVELRISIFSVSRAMAFEQEHVSFLRQLIFFRDNFWIDGCNLHIVDIDISDQWLGIRVSLVLGGHTQVELLPRLVARQDCALTVGDIVTVFYEGSDLVVNELDSDARLHTRLHVDLAVVVLAHC